MESSSVLPFAFGCFLFFILTLDTDILSAILFRDDCAHVFIGFRGAKARAP